MVDKVEPFLRYFRTEWEIWSSASGHANLLYGEEAESVFASFSLSAADRKKYQTVLDTFTSHFARKNKCHLWKSKIQQQIAAEGESVEAFIIDVISLARFYDYVGLKEEIRDRIVIRIRDARLSERLQMGAELTLQKYLDQVLDSEQGKKHQGVVRSSSTSIHAVKSKP